MDQFSLFLIAALTGVGAFAGWLVRWAFAHLESDLAYTRSTAQRGTETAEKAAAALADKAAAVLAAQKPDV